MDENFDQIEMEDHADLLRVKLDAYEGPLQVLLQLARHQKVDLHQISITELVDQYISFIREAKAMRLEIAADYLVMAAWLAYLKSRLLLPVAPDDDEEMSPEEMSARLAFQLRRLEAIQKAGDVLMARPRLGQDRFVRGMTTPLKRINKPLFEASLFDLISAYEDVQRREEFVAYDIRPVAVYTVEEAILKLKPKLGHIPDWQILLEFLPNDLHDALMWKSALASTFVASLELARTGKLKIQQSGAFGPIYIKSSEQDFEEERAL